MRAIVDERLGARIVSTRELVYSEPAAAEEDRPDHVRAASGIASDGERLFVIQDDTNFIAVVEGEHVRAIALPFGAGGRRRFETRLGNKLDKLDLEGCYFEDGELVAFGSGSIPIVRDNIVRVRGDRVELVEARALYAAIREAIGGPINVEGAVRFGEQTWLFHRGNSGPDDHAAIICVERERIVDVIRCELGEISGVRFGFTDAATVGDRVFVACAAEASPDAIADGDVLGSRIGVLDGDVIRCAPLDRTLKIEGLVITRDRTWITIDPDDVDAPAQLCEVELSGPW